MRASYVLVALLAALVLSVSNASAQALFLDSPGLSTFPESSFATDFAGNFSQYRLFPCRLSPMEQSFRNQKPSNPTRPPYHRSHASPIENLAQSSCGRNAGPKYFILENPGFAEGSTVDSTSRVAASEADTTYLSDSDFSSSKPGFEPAYSPSSTTRENSREGFHWWPALQQSFNFLVLEHGFRMASDTYLRYLLWHKPFWHDWAASDKHFYLNQWGDGDDFIVNYIGHPLEGGVTGNIYIVNDPKGRSLTFGRSRAYWMSRLRAMAFAAVYSAQFEAGPMLSESAIGSEGGYFYKPGCDPGLTCTTASNKPITNNTGWVDFVVTPVVGIGWIVLEDSIETEIVDRLSKGDNGIGWKIMRASLSPSHVMANFVAGKTPWYRYRLDGDGGSLFNWHQDAPPPKFSFDGVQRWEIGAHYSYLSLPVATETCVSCRVGNSGFGGNFAYRLTNRLWIDSDVNYFPGSGGHGGKGSMVEGLFGPRYGYTGKSWGLYFKLRPGFIYYDKTLTVENGSQISNATRFAFDVGSEFEWYVSRHSAIRFDAGTTVVRYLTGRDDPKQPVGNILSTDYIVAQSNFQFGTGYTYRF
jgi:hypothetical protein